MSVSERWSLATALGFALAVVGAIASALGLVLIKSSHALGCARARRRRWVTGTLVLCIVNPICDVFALWLAPLSLLSPLGALAVIASLILGRYLLHERPSRLQWALASAATLAVAAASVAGPHEDAMPAVQKLDSLFDFVSGWLLSVLALSLIVLAMDTPRMKPRLHARAARLLGLATPFAAGATGSVCALFVKMDLYAAAAVVRGEETFGEGISHRSTLVAATMLAPAAILQLTLLNAALSQSALAESAPVYQVTFSLCVLLTGALLLNETSNMGRTRLVAFSIGVGFAAACSFVLGLLRAPEPASAGDSAAQPCPTPTAPLAASDGSGEARADSGTAASGVILHLRATDPKSARTPCAGERSDAEAQGIALVTDTSYDRLNELDSV
jgi:hypothetical protein